MVRCPVCESHAIRIVLNSKPHASCATCGSRWIQEGSWQRAVRPGQGRLSILGTNVIGSVGADVTGIGSTPHADDVILLPDPVRRRHRTVAKRSREADEAIAT